MEGLEISARLTPAAVTKLKQLAAPNGRPIVRLFVNGRRCCGVRYGLALDREIRDGHASIKQDGIVLVVDPQGQADCDGAVIDYVETTERSGFAVTNPANTSACARCGG